MKSAILIASIVLGLLVSRLLFVGTRPLALVFPKNWQRWLLGESTRRSKHAH
jgi:hypothetical protein